MRQGSLRLILVLAASAAIASSTVLAATSGTIRGNARANTLRGTPGADTIYGLGGNDKLYGGAGNDLLVGGAGNDLLVGGPGADRFSCGAGKDTVTGDAQDKAAKDCEKVKGIPAPVVPPKAECANGKDDDGDTLVDGADPGCAGPTDGDETDPPPAKPLVQPGTYCGFTDQGPGLCVTTDGTVVTKFETSAIVDCAPASRWTWTVTFSNRTIVIQPDSSFEYSYSGPLSSSGAASNVQESEFVKGKFTSDGKATGTLAMSSMSYDFEGTHYTCTQNPVGWHAARQG